VNVGYGRTLYPAIGGAAYRTTPDGDVLMGRFSVIAGLFREFRLFLKEDRTWWLLPVLIALLSLGTFIIFVQGSAMAPLIYALF
jgi:hypothetical protein